jgi:hypothetical protein
MRTLNGDNDYDNNNSNIIGNDDDAMHLMYNKSLPGNKQSSQTF